MYVLDKLWRGEISPTDCYFRQGSIYQQTAKEVCSRMDAFLQMLTPEAKEYLEAINDLKSDLALMENEEHFINGFRMGGRMMLDIIGEYRGQFCFPTEAE